MKTIATPLLHPFPCRLLFPVLACQAGLLVLCAPRMCRSAGLQQGYGMARQVLQRLPWPAALRAARTARGGASTAHQLCASAYQPFVVILGGLLVGYLAYVYEHWQRRSFLQRRRGTDQQRPPLGSCGQPACMLDYWYFFGLPLACMLAWLHLSVLHLSGAVQS